MILLPQNLVSPRTTQFYRRFRAFAGVPAGRTRKAAFVPRLAALEDRTLLATTLVVDPAGGTGVFTTIQAAVNVANAAGGDTIDIHPATYMEQVTIDKSLTMMSTAPGVIIQAPATLTPDNFGLNVLVEVNNAATVNISNLTISGPAPNINDGILIVGGATANVTGTTVTQIQDLATFGDQTGFGIQIGGTGTQAVGQVGNATITDCTVTAYQKVGIIVGRSGSTGTITGTTITGAGPTTLIAQNGMQIGPGAASATVSDTTISGNQFTGTGSGADGVQASGILDFIGSTITGNTIHDNDLGLVSSPAGATAADTTLDIADLVPADLTTTTTGPGAAVTGNSLSGNLFENIIIRQGTTNVTGNTITDSNIGLFLNGGGSLDTVANIESNTITNNGNGGLPTPNGGIVMTPGSGGTTTDQATANFNRIFGNSVGVDNTTTTPADATLNWWGSNTGPNTTGSDTTTGTGTVNTSPWPVLSLAASPATIGSGATAVVTADLTKDSNGATHSTAPFFPDQTPIAFSATGGTITPASVATISGVASSDFTSSTPGTASASVTLDNQTLSTPLTIQSLPTVTGLSPTSGPAAGGTLETITGTGFTGATVVAFGTTAATGVTVVNDTTITATSPAGTGVVDVTVTTPTGTSATSAADQFTFVAAAAPTVTGVSPTTGSAAGGTSVTITGTGFTGATAVNFGTIPAKSFTVVNDTTIDAVTPEATGAVNVTVATGAVNVTVVTPNGTSPSSAAAQFTFVAAPPTVVSLVRFGFHAQQTSLVLTFSAALNPTPAQDVNNYEILAMNGIAIPISSAVYDPATLTVTLVPSELLSLHTFYQLTVNGATPNGLTSSTGIPLDGKGNGTPGTNFVSMFGGGILVGPAPAMLSAQPKRFAAEKKQLAVDKKKWATEVKKANANRKHAAVAAKKLAATEKKLATQLERANGPSASAVDELSALGALIARPKAIRVQTGRHHPRG
jgi:IPT/TIG domain